MRFKTWPVAALGLAGLLLLVVFSVITASQRAQEIYTQLDQLNTHHQEVETKLRALRADVHLSGIFVRDYLLDTARERAPEYRSAAGRSFARPIATTLRGVARHRTTAAARTKRASEISKRIWTTTGRGSSRCSTGPSSRRSTTARRSSVAKSFPAATPCWPSPQEIEELNNQNLAAQRAEVTRRHDAFRSELTTLLGRSLFFGLLLAVPVVIRLRVLEKRSEDQKDPRAGCRGADARAVAAAGRGAGRRAPEALARAARSRRPDAHRAAHGAGPHRSRAGLPATAASPAAVAECRQLVDDMVHIVRDLALGLRPSMLDDFGLQPALEWLARDFTRRSNVPVELARHRRRSTALSDQHRTCIYRVVQEALTNCVRHARATAISVSVRARDDAHRGDGERRRHRARPAAAGRRLRTARHRGARARARRDRSRLRARAGKGATLAIRLPIDHGASHLRVLLADDHGIVRRGLRSLIETAAGHQGGRRSRRRPRGAEAVRRASARRHHPGRRRCRS